jgi:TPR repeat protein
VPVNSDVRHHVTAAEDIYYDLPPEEAEERLLELAERGDHEAEFYLGHLADESLSGDPVGAFAWYTKAAAGGLLEAKHWVASFTYHGMGTSQDVAAAVRLFRECAEAGLDTSQWKLGQHLLQFPQSRAEALRWLDAAANQGHTGAFELLAKAGGRDV